MSEEREHQLPACQKCKLRKVKCDRSAPKCTNCVKSSAACIIVDPITGEQYARDYIRQLEEKEQDLRQKLSETDDRGVVTPAFTERSVAVNPTSTGPRTASSTTQSGFVGDGSGLGFLQNILSDTKWQHHRAQILEQLANHPRIATHEPVPKALPPLVRAQQLFDGYFTRFHIHHPFLLREEMLNVFNRVYSLSATSESPSAQDFFRIFMVFAISETTRHRACQDTTHGGEHPYGYYFAAEAYLSQIPLIQNPEAIQNLLLIARFGMYHHIGASLWEISRLCMRQCIEWGFHLRADKTLQPLKAQHQRRIFWECYVHDRYSSGILGRPFALLESEISMPLPIDANDETITTSGASELESVPIITDMQPSELSVNLFCIRLRQLSSRIHTAFYTSRKPAYDRAIKDTSSSGFRSIGHVYSSFSHFRDELHAVRASAPVFIHPRCLYERSEWHDFMYEKDCLLLARGAMHNLPARQFSGASILKEILTACYISATRTIELYAHLRSTNAITWTRSYFQVIFTAGLTVIYCVILDVLNDNQRLPTTCTDPLQSLDTCSSLLDYFKDKMPDVGSFATVYDGIKMECVKDRFASRLPLPPSSLALPTSGNGQLLVDQHSTPHALPSQPINPVPLDSSIDAFNLNNLLPNDGQQQPRSDAHSFFRDFPDITSTQLPEDFGMGLTDDLMNQLESGLGEYAWGSLSTDIGCWNIFGYE